jgi:hypothetical protein
MLGLDSCHTPTSTPGRDEITGGQTRTWSNFHDAGGSAGAVIPTGTTVLVSCRTMGFETADGNPWWYRIAAPPWDNRFYASADAFYNSAGLTSGPLAGGPMVDLSVPQCDAFDVPTAGATGRELPSPVVSVAPSSGDHSTLFVGTATGFTPDGPVTVSAVMPNGSPYPNTYPKTADHSGAFTWSWQWDPGDPDGVWTIRFVDDSSGAATSTTITIAGSR